MAVISCSAPKSGSDGEHPADGSASKIELITLNPGHFHAYLVQKSMYEEVDSVVHVFAPDGDEVRAHLEKIESRKFS